MGKENRTEPWTYQWIKPVRDRWIKRVRDRWIKPIRDRWILLVKEERGSISVLIIGLFVIALSASLVLTDISSHYLAKRSLTQVAESIAQSAMHNLDEETYYSSEYNLQQLAANMFLDAESDPGIPIDCDKGRVDALRFLSGIAENDASIRSNLHNIYMTEYSCDGYQVAITLEGEVEYPVLVPWMSSNTATMQSTVSVLLERKS